MAHNYCTCWGNRGSCIDCAEEEIDRLTAQLAEAKTANQSMHGMILEIRKHFNAWDTPKAPTDKDIVDCIISSHNKQLAVRDGAITCYNEVLAELREEVATLRHQSINWVPVFDANMELQIQNAALRGEVEKYKCLDGFKQLQEEARKQAAQEIVEMMGGWPLSNSTLAQCRQSIRQRYGLEG